MYAIKTNHSDGTNEIIEFTDVVKIFAKHESKGECYMRLGEDLVRHEDGSRMSTWATPLFHNLQAAKQYQGMMQVIDRLNQEVKNLKGMAAELTADNDPIAFWRSNKPKWNNPKRMQDFQDQGTEEMFTEMKEGT